MRKKSLGLTIVFLALALVIGFFAPWKSPNISLAASLKPYHWSDPKRARAELEECLRNCSPEEADLVRRMIKMLVEIKENPNSDRVFNELPRVQGKILSDMLDLYMRRDDTKAAVKTLVLIEGYNITFQEKADPNLSESKFEQTLAALEKAHPESADVFGEKGSHLALQAGHEFQAIEAFLKCAKLDPKEAGCQKRYGELVRQVTEEHCASDDIYPELGFYIGVDQATENFSREMRDGSKTIYVQPSAVLDRRDIESVKIGKGEFNQTVFHISFKAEGKERLARLTTDNRGKLMVVAVKDQVLIAPRIQEPIKEGRAELTLGRQLDISPSLQTFCEKTTKPELPKELVL